MAVNDPDSYGRVGHRQGKRGGDRLVAGLSNEIFTAGPAYLIIVATDDMHIRRNCPQIIVGFTVANIAGAKDLLYLAWYKKLLEF